MQTINITSIASTLIFSGRFPTKKQCVEAAVADRVDLSGADLRGANLGNAMLDGAMLGNACFDSANLCGANMSEANLAGSRFVNAGLQNACLCYSVLDGCDFTACDFGATDIAGASLRGASFSTLSAFTLNFRDASAVADCRFTGADGVPCPFSRAPVVLTGPFKPIVLLDNHIRIGTATFSLRDWLPLLMTQRAAG